MVIHTTVALADVRVAVLDIANEAGITPTEADYLTDRVRDAVMRKLPASRFTIMTRESVIELLPPGVDPADCSEAECEIEIGKMLGAAYIVTGEVLNFAGELRLNLKTHHCATAAFLGSETVKGSDLRQLEDSIRETAGQLGAQIKKHGEGLSLGGGFQPGSGDVAPAGDWMPEFIKKVIVSFKSDPPGAQVILNGSIIHDKITPFSIEVEVGLADVSMQKGRYWPKEETLDIRSNQDPGEVNWTLEPNFGWLSVTSDPPGLRVEIDDRETGITPLIDFEVSPGEHRVQLINEQYYPAWENTFVHRGERYAISFTPPPREGGLQVSAKDSEGNALVADVFVDSKEFGITPCTEKLLIGKHRVEVASGNQGRQGEITITEQQVSILTVELTELVTAGEPAISDRFARSSWSLCCEVRNLLPFEPNYEDGGVRVTYVYPNSPASGKLNIGDIIMRIGGKDARNRQDFNVIMGNLSYGETLILLVFREGESKYGTAIV